MKCKHCGQLIYQLGAGHPMQGLWMHLGTQLVGCTQHHLPEFTGKKAEPETVVRLSYQRTQGESMKFDLWVLIVSCIICSLAGTFQGFMLGFNKHAAMLASLSDTQIHWWVMKARERRAAKLGVSDGD